MMFLQRTTACGVKLLLLVLLLSGCTYNILSVKTGEGSNECAIHVNLNEHGWEEWQEECEGEEDCDDDEDCDDEEDCGGEEECEDDEKEFWHKKEWSKKDWPDLKERIEEAVESGEISRRQANQKYAYIKKHMAERQDYGRAALDDHKIYNMNDYNRAEAKMLHMLAAGKVKPQEVQKRLQMMRRSLLSQMKNKQADKGQKQRGGDRHKLDWDRIKKDIEGAVKSGEMTREEADEEYARIKKRLEQRKKR